MSAHANGMDLSTPYLTQGLPGISGTIKAIPQDFEVEEIPSYEPCGNGDHLFLWIEKRGVAAETLLQHVARVLQISPNEIGMAGMKDRHALTRQFLSVPRSAEAVLDRINTSEIQCLSARPHTQKLRTGHLRGNRFRILVRDVPSDAAERAEAVCNILRRSGLANFFGHQRFGRGQETADIGMQLLRGHLQSPPIHWSRKRFLRKLALSAAQAVLFNAYLAQRMQDGLLHTVLEGDVMSKQTGGMFYVTDRDAEQARMDARETVHAGPIFGKKMFAAHGEAAEREAAILKRFDLATARFHAFGKLLTGTRRRNLIYLDDLHVSQLPHGLELRFSMPAGSYATVLLGEIMKPEHESDPAAQ